ncbi:MAG: hypothetical protein ACOCVD_02720 [Bacillota bacterium]
MSKENRPNNGHGGFQRNHMAKVYTSKRLHKNDYKHSRFQLLTKFDGKRKPQNIIIDTDIGLFK